jgi:DNA-binding protein H-NS
MAFEDLSADQLRDKLAQTESELAAIARALEERHEAQKGEVALQVRTLILDAGYDLDEILALVPQKKARRSRRRAAPAPVAPVAPPVPDPSYPSYADPENPERVYVRGVLPGWMKALMIEKGYDPKDKASREAFKANVLVRQG